MRLYLCKHCVQDINIGPEQSYKFRSFAKWMKHLATVHISDPGFFVSCGISGCGKKYEKIASFKKHLKRKHRLNDDPPLNIFISSLADTHADFEIHIDGSLPEFEAAGSQGDPTSDVDMDVGVEDHIPDMYESETEHEGPESIVDHLAKMILKLRVRYKVYSEVPQYVLEEMEYITDLIKKDTEEKVRLYLSSRNFDIADFPGLSETILSNTAMQAAVQSLNSTYKQDNFFRERFCLVDPTEIVLSRGVKNKPIDTYQYVPLKDTLVSLLRHRDVRNEVNTGHQTCQSDPSRIQDFCDGSLFAENELFQKCPKHLQILAYVDEFTVTNPLRNKAKKYKVTAVYYVLGNLQPKFRSRLYVIQIACLARSIHVKKYGLEKIFEPFLRDLKDLENVGISVSFSAVNLKGTLCLVSGDNLGSHQIGGYNESFSSGLICRHCMATKDDIQNTFDINSFTPRTVESYNDQAAMVALDPALSRTYGLKKGSVLNSLSYYHVAEGLPPDVAHDVFEGVACDVLLLVIKHCCEEGFFDLKFLNEAIQTLEYGESDKSSRPSEVKEEMSKFAIKQTASQTWCLLRLLGILVGEEVPMDNDVWGLLLDLQDIVDILCCPSIPTSVLDYLQELIRDFLLEWHHLFPQHTMKPKAHYLLHYPLLIRKFSTPTCYWTLRFEGKHNVIKEIAQRSKNVKNICLTMATKHQLQQCYEGVRSEFLAYDTPQFVKEKALDKSLITDEAEEMLKMAGVRQANETAYKTYSAVVFEGARYSAGCAVLIGPYKEVFFEFGLVDCVFSQQGKPLLLIQKCQTQFYERHIHAFIVEPLDDFTLLSPVSLLNPHPLSMHQTSFGRAVVMHHMVYTD